MLLLSAAADGWITDLPDGLGQGYGTNGDQFYIWNNMPENPGPRQGGPVSYGSREWDDPNQLANTIIQASIPPLRPGVASRRPFRRHCCRAWRDWRPPTRP